MEDVRKLVPRTPPEGMMEWAAQRCEDLNRDGLIIETVWAQDWSLEAILDEWSVGKKVRAIRATCSACAESALLWRVRDGHGSYGFLHPADDWDGVYGDGDETVCPFCGAPVVVRSKSKLRSRGYFVAGADCVMSAAVVGAENLLVLTGWRMERRIYANARRELRAIPAEAYVFSGNDCAQLMGWRNAYSGNSGYFVQYTGAWSQPKNWKECWGSERALFGLTPELVAGSCLPHCKLDVYMEPRVGSIDRYPVAWLRLCQAHPGAEHVLVSGLPRVLDSLLDETVGTCDWVEQNKAGRFELPELRWDTRRPAGILSLTREELRMAQEQDWDAMFWRLFLRAKAAGERLTGEDMVNAFLLGDKNVGLLVGRGPVAKSLRYLLRQAEGMEPEDEDPDPEDEDPDPNGVIDVQLLVDYWSMAERVGCDLRDPAVRFPDNLLAAHDTMTDLAAAKEDAELNVSFRVRRKLLRRWAFAADGLLIRPAASQRELISEGDALHHCVKTYAKKHARGDSAIFFIRRASAPNIPWFTLELDEKKLKVLQNRGKYNCGRTPEVEAFEARWLAWLRAGAPRRRDGKPVEPEKGKRKGCAA